MNRKRILGLMILLSTSLLIIVFTLVINNKPVNIESLLGLVSIKPVEELDPQDYPECALQGMRPPEDYLKSYEVADGDTFKSIAEKQLGNPDRAVELVNLNKDGFSERSEEEPELTPDSELKAGTTVFLPPEFIKSSNGYIPAVSGNVWVRSEKVWSVSYPNSRAGEFSTLVLPKYGLEAGDCVTVIYEGYGTGVIFDVIKQ